MINHCGYFRAGSEALAEILGLLRSSGGPDASRGSLETSSHLHPGVQKIYFV